MLPASASHPWTGAAPAHHLGQRDLGPLVKDRADEVVLAGKPPVEGPHADPRLACDRLDGGLDAVRALARAGPAAVALGVGARALGERHRHGSVTE